MESPDRHAMSDDLKLWLALDPEEGVVRLVLNGHTVGRLVSDKGEPRIRLDDEHRAQFAAVEPYAQKLFAMMGETMLAALFEIGSFRVLQFGDQQAKRIPPERRTQIQLGCGPDLREGWLNVDYNPSGTLGYDPARNFLNYDLRKGLPLPDASADLIFSSHFFEHLRHEHAVQLMREGRRVLKPGARMRFQMPDYVRAFNTYLKRDPEQLSRIVNEEQFLDYMPSYSRQWGDVISRAIFEFYEHKYIWDPENLATALKAAGFSDAYEDKLIEDLDKAARDDASFYMWAIA